MCMGWDSAGDMVNERFTLASTSNTLHACGYTPYHLYSLCVSIAQCLDEEVHLERTKRSQLRAARSEPHSQVPSQPFHTM